MRKQRDSKRKENILAIFIAVIMIGSVFGVIFYGFSTSSTKHRYKDYTFKQASNSYTTKINGKSMTFYYLPEDVEKLEIPQSVKDLIRNSPAPVITFSPKDRNVQTIELIRFELGDMITSGTIDKMFVPGITESSSQYNIPVIDCINTSAMQPVIRFQTGNSTKIVDDNKCIIMQAQSSSEFLRLRDAMLYIITGVID